jgi:hypothetical protein
VSTPLDEILSKGGETMPSAETTTEKPVSQEQPQAAEQTAQQPGEAEPETHEGPDGRKMVPIEALHAERGKAKRYTEQVASFEKRLDETNTAWERRMAQLLERLTPPQQPQQAPDFFDDPAKATQHLVAPHFQQISQHLQAIAKDNAIVRFSEAEVDEAEQAFLAALKTEKLDPADYDKVVNSPNRFAAAVQWHKRQQAQAEIGDDPAAFRAKVEAEILAKHGLSPDGNGVQNGQQQQARPATFPSNLANARNVGARTGPAWGGPQPVESIFALKRKGSG